MPLTDSLIGRQLGDYRIDDLLGRGGMAHVYRGYDPKLQRYAAVKVIDANLLAHESDDEYRLRFQREARAIAHLNHPNIVGVYQFGEFDSLYYMAMVFIEGRDLGQVLKEHAANRTVMAHEQVLRIVRDIASALDYAHAAGVIHRDIKPSNIMVTPDHRAILTDFGLALSVPEGTLGNTFGSAYYIAPEQAISSANAVPQSDLYALGVVLYQMLVGRVPFDDPSAMSVALMHLSESPPAPRKLNAALTPAVEAVLLRALEKEPSKRYENGAALVRALEAAIGKGGGTSAMVAQEPRQAVTPVFPDSIISASRLRVIQAKRALDTGSRWRVVLLAAVIVLVLFGGAVIVLPLMRGEGAEPAPTEVSALVDATEEATEAPTAPTTAPSTTRVASATLLPIILDASDTPAPTRTPTTAPSATPTLTDTPRPTATFTLIAAAEITDVIEPSPDDLPILLRYSNQTLTLFNRSDRSIDIRFLYFAQRSPIFGEIAFDAQQWETPMLRAARPGSCFMIWRNNLIEPETPDYCDEREAWFAAGNASRFWISSQPDATFDVRSAGRVVATCEVSAGECAFDP